MRALAWITTSMLVGLFGLPPVWAQDAAREDELRTVMPLDPSFRTGVNPPAGGAVIEAGTEESTAKIHLGWKVRPNHVLSFEVSAPIDPSTGEATFVGLDGPTPSIALELGWSRPPTPVRTLAAATNRDFSSRTTRELVRESYDRKLIVYPVATLGIGWDDFDFLDPTTLAEDSEDRYSYTASAGVGLLTKKMHLIALSYRYKRSYTAQSPVNLCTPIPGSTALQCEESVIGAPDRLNRSIASIEYRKEWKYVAIGPRIARDFEQDVTGADFPVYILRDSGSGGFSGGVRAGWQSDSHDFAASVFVGKVFKVLQN